MNYALVCDWYPHKNYENKGGFDFWVFDTEQEAKEFLNEDDFTFYAEVNLYDLSKDDNEPVRQIKEMLVEDMMKNLDSLTKES